MAVIDELVRDAETTLAAISHILDDWPQPSMADTPWCHTVYPNPEYL